MAWYVIQDHRGWKMVTNNKETAKTMARRLKGAQGNLRLKAIFKDGEQIWPKQIELPLGKTPLPSILKK